MEAYREGLPPLEEDWPWDVCAVVEYIQKHLFEEGLTVALIRKECGVRKGISGRFRHYVGMGIKEYITDHQIALAERLLSFDGVTVTETALTVGYNSCSAFAQAFEKREGCAPSAFGEN